MKKKFAAFVLCLICLLSAVGCGQAKRILKRRKRPIRVQWPMII